MNNAGKVQQAGMESRGFFPPSMYPLESHSDYVSLTNEDGSDLKTNKMIATDKAQGTQEDPGPKYIHWY